MSDETAEKLKYAAAALTLFIGLLIIIIPLTVLYLDCRSSIGVAIKSNETIQNCANDSKRANSTLDGTLRKGFGVYCGTAEICLDGLVCNFRLHQCSCPERYQVYIPELMKCGSKVGGHCNDSVPCAKYSVCKKVGRKGKRVCACPKGIPPNDELGCDVDIGKECESSLDCNPDFGFQCIDGACQCVGLSKYSWKKRRYEKLIGALCDPRRERRFRPIEFDCAENSFCQSKEQRSFIELNGFCNCSSGFKVSSHHTCIPVQ